MYAGFDFGSGSNLDKDIVILVSGVGVEACKGGDDYQIDLAVLGSTGA